MKKRSPLLYLLLLILAFGFSCCNRKSEPWLLFETNDGEFGYANSKGDTMIRAGKYSICFSDTLETFGIVFDKDRGIIGINQAEEILFNVFSYDNGPDYVSDGLFRIVVDSKIGYADEDGRIVIKPEYLCAYPFEKGQAKVSLDCSKSVEGEHSTWESDDWFYIDKNGEIVQ